MSAEEAYEKGIKDAENIASAAGPIEKDPTEKRMYVRTQNFGSSEEEMRFLQRNGVRHKAAIFPFHEGIGWKIDDLERERERHEHYGMTLDMSSLPIYERFPNIIYHGKSPERD
ncbi:MAG: hypothetical protein CME28_08460, partial [Gemmatimonadetes bacterium]|nr:hypothetical protein [Gemmatimonadota bacterium]